MRLVSRPERGYLFSIQDYIFPADSTAPFREETFSWIPFAALRLNVRNLSRTDANAGNQVSNAGSPTFPGVYKTANVNI